MGMRLKWTGGGEFVYLQDFENLPEHIMLFDMIQPGRVFGYDMAQQGQGGQFVSACPEPFQEFIEYVSVIRFQEHVNHPDRPRLVVVVH